jgi:hypothetical protein
MIAKQKFRVASLLLTVFFLISGLRATAQINQSQESRFLNFENSPVALEGLGNSHQVRNTSSKTVVKFTLACVASEGKRRTIISRFPVSETNLAPGYTVGEIRVDSPSSSEICAARKVRLAVIDVTFSDGSQWHAPLQKGAHKAIG